MDYFSPTARCSKAEIDTLLAEHRSLLNNLELMQGSMKAEQSELQQSHLCLWQEHLQVKEHCKHMQEALTVLHEDYEATRDCLVFAGYLCQREVESRMSNRRATGLLSRILEAPELATQLGEYAGISALRHMSVTSLKHGRDSKKAIPAVESRSPADLYVVGGKDDTAPALASAERYSFRTELWEPLPPMRAARYGCAAAALEGKLYVVGGHDGRLVLAAAERFDPLTGKWEYVPNMPTARSRCAANSVRGHLYVVGGKSSRHHVTAAERFDPRTGIWEHLPPMPLAPMSCAAAALDDALYVVGAAQQRTMAVQKFDFRAHSWQTVAAVPKQRFGCAVAGVNGALYVVGGHDGNQAVAFNERLTVPSASSFGRNAGLKTDWQLLQPMITGRHGCAAVAAGGALYVLGGDGDGDGQEHTMRAAEVFHPERGCWELMAPMTAGRFGCAAAAMYD
eukprot:TRINITY_DN19564_c0_g2_i2.p1 TRINITY_DN19564_c0_g2~~TRINITY_DN19564_c0_g2_i2.p1  ORF type:complete len:452 (-),score=98.79 TRINITY_DN19564_c0_g2_i2:109-1464(-)